MAYRRPAVTVTQEFVGLQPALAAFALPSVIIGAAFQHFTDDPLGSYAGSSVSLPYASLPGGFQVDIAAADPLDAFPASHAPIAVRIAGALLTIVGPAATSGAPVDNVTFFDSTASVFADVATGDKLTVASGPNAGNYIVRAKVDDNHLTLQSPLADTSVLSMSYGITRVITSVALVRETDYTASSSAISLMANLTSSGFPITAGTVLASYNALRNDLASSVNSYADLTAVQTFFGTSQLGPSNPLAFGLLIALQNTVTPVSGLGLNELALSDEVLSHGAALDVIKTTDMYCLCPLSQNPALHPVYKVFVEGESAPAKGRERVAVINRQIKTIETLVSEALTVTSISGARIIVNTATDGTVTGIALSTLVGTSNQFSNVRLGDSVTVTGGTNSTPGVYTVITKTDAQTIVVNANFATGAATDIAYFISRKDGLGADGVTFYDRNASFLSNGVAPGHFLEILSGSYSGRYKISSVNSEVMFTLAAAVPGVTTLQTAVDYDVDRDMSKDEQATFLGAYSHSIGSRRVVNMWPDQLSIPVGNTVKLLPGFYGGCAIAGATTGLPTQQGFTNLSLSGFLGLNHSTKYFNDDQLDVIADGGTMILAQDGPDQPLYVRHQLTTDRSAIKFQEYSLTKNVDFAAKFIRNQYKPFLGQYNIVTTTLDELKTSAKGIISFLSENTKLPKIGGVIKSGALVKLVQDPANIDAVLMRFELNFPIPLNNIDITIQA